MKGKGIMSADVSGACPCGGTFAAGKVPAAVVHSMPPCADFIEREPDAYLRFVREWHERKRPEA